MVAALSGKAATVATGLRTHKFPDAALASLAVWVAVWIANIAHRDRFKLTVGTENWHEGSELQLQFNIQFNAQFSGCGKLAQVANCSCNLSYPAQVKLVGFWIL